MIDPDGYAAAAVNTPSISTCIQTLALNGTCCCHSPCSKVLKELDSEDAVGCVEKLMMRRRERAREEEGDSPTDDRYNRLKTFACIQIPAGDAKDNPTC